MSADELKINVDIKPYSLPFIKFYVNLVNDLIRSHHCDGKQEEFLILCCVKRQQLSELCLSERLSQSRDIFFIIINKFLVELNFYCCWNFIIINVTNKLLLQHDFYECYKSDKWICVNLREFAWIRLYFSINIFLIAKRIFSSWG